MLSAQQQKQLDGFNNAKKIALSIPAGHYRLARNSDDTLSDFYGFKDRSGDMFVMTEIEGEFGNPDAVIEMGNCKYYARRVSGGHTVMSR